MGGGVGFKWGDCSGRWSRRDSIPGLWWLGASVRRKRPKRGDDEAEAHHGEGGGHPGEGGSLGGECGAGVDLGVEWWFCAWSLFYTVFVWVWMDQLLFGFHWEASGRNVARPTEENDGDGGEGNIDHPISEVADRKVSALIFESSFIEDVSTVKRDGFFV